MVIVFAIRHLSFYLYFQCFEYALFKFYLSILFVNLIVSVPCTVTNIRNMKEVL
jgi:hypothetical protein